MYAFFSFISPFSVHVVCPTIRTEDTEIFNIKPDKSGDNLKFLRIMQRNFKFLPVLQTGLL